MNTTELKELLIKTNKEYREGVPSITDQEFDAYLDEYRLLVSDDEYQAFRKTLFESTGKVKHPYIMGSLEKIRAEDYNSSSLWISSNLEAEQNYILIMAKIDGMSCRLHYSNGQLTEAVSRGDGFYGENLLDKVSQIVPTKISMPGEVDIRGELVITKNDFERLCQIQEFKNPRNATVGIMGRKDDFSLVKFISFFGYEIMGSDLGRFEQLQKLTKVFNYSRADVVYFCRFPAKEITNEFLEELYNINFKEACRYETDGLVLCSPDYISENKKIPDGMIAYKFNDLIATTTIIDIDWGLPSKDGRLIPVAIIDPVELGGAMISRVTCYNAEWLDRTGLKYGSTVTILKSGDIIPRIIDVKNDNPYLETIELITVCPSCGEDLKWDGVDLRCKNPQCKNQTSHQAAQFIRKLGVKGFSKKTIENLGLNTIDEILAFNPDHVKVSPSIRTFYNNLWELLLKTPFKSLLTCCNWPGISDITFNKIWHSVYALKKYNAGYPQDIAGFTQSVLNEMSDKALTTNLRVAWKTFLDHFSDNVQCILPVIFHPNYQPRYAEVADQKSEKFVFTGALYSVTRKAATDMAIKAGYSVGSGISKDTTYLVTNDANSNSTKAKKARELNIKIISEDEFLEMIRAGNKSSVESSLEDL